MGNVFYMCNIGNLSYMSYMWLLWQRNGERSHMLGTPRMGCMSDPSPRRRARRSDVPRGARAVQRALLARPELALDLGPERQFINVCVSREDKEALDAVQAWYSYREARRVPHWELFNLLLAEALANPEGRFYKMTQRLWL